MGKLSFLLALCLGFQGLLLASGSPALDPNERLALINKITKIIKDANDINAPDEKGRPPLILATLANDKKLVELLLSAGVNIRTADADGNTALHIAVAENYFPLVEYLLDKGAQINTQNNSGQTSLLIAICQRNTKMTEYLLGRQANPDIQSNCLYPPLHQAIINQDYPSIKLLLKYHANINALDNNGQAPLHLAIQQDDPNSVALLLEQNANPNLLSKDGFTPLDMAVASHHLPIMKLLLEKNADVDQLNWEGESALYIASSDLGSDPNVVSLLLQSGANPNIPTPTWIYPLRAAKNIQRKAVADILEKYGALEFGSRGPKMPSFVPKEYITTDNFGNESLVLDGVVYIHNNKPTQDASQQTAHIQVDIPPRAKVETLTAEFIASGEWANYKDEYGYTLLDWTLCMGFTPEAEQLISQGADVNTKSIFGTTPLILAAGHGTKSIVSQILQRGANVNTADINGWTALHQAHDAEIVDLLLQAGADVNAKTIFDTTPLWDAVRYDAKDAVKKLLDAGANIEATDYRGTTPLLEACNCDRFEIVRLLVEKGANINTMNAGGVTPLLNTCERKDIPEYLVNHGADITVTYADGSSLLHVAVDNKNLNLAELLLQKGLNVNAVTHQKQTALHLAAQAGNEPIVKLLLEHGADASLKDSAGKTAFDLAKKEKHLAIVTLLDPDSAKTVIPLTKAEQRQRERKKRRENFNNPEFDVVAVWLAADSTPLHKAAIANDPNQVKKLMAAKADPNVFCDIKGHNVSPLHCAAYFDNEDIARYLIRQGVNPNQFDPGKKMTALHYAIENKHIEMVEMLLDNGVDLKLKVYQDNPPLMLAACCGTVEIIKTLCSKGIDLNQKNAKGDNLLHQSIYNPGTLESLILAGVDVNAKNTSGETPLFRAVEAGELESVKIFLKHGADINTQNVNGETALCRAIISESIPMLTFLIEQGDDVNLPDQLDRTPIYLALRSAEMTKILLKAGANLNIMDKYGKSPIHELSEMFSEKELYTVLIDLFSQNNISLDTPDKEGRTLIGMIIPNAPVDEDELQERLDFLNLLIAKGADINHQNAQKETPLHLALETSNTEFLQALLAAGANMEIVNQDGDTPLLYAILNQRVNHCRLLVEKGANINAKTSSGQTCFQLATIVKNSEIIDLLKKHGAME